ncbi:hypothetical protein D3C86_1855770 [compost metagenome]
MLHHLPFQLVDFLLQRFRRQQHFNRIGLNRMTRFAASFGFRQTLTERQNIHHLLVQTLWRNAVFFVVLLLFLSTALRFANGFGHRCRDFVTVQNRFTVDVTCRTTNGLN